MNILAIDSTGNKTSVASKIGDDLLSLSIHHNRKDRPDWQSLLEKISISSDDLQNFDLFTFGQGPGSYTSIRSVATFLKAIALIHQKPLMPLSNLECIAYGHSLLYKNDSIIHSAISSDIDSEIYYSSYELKNSLLTPLSHEAILARDDLDSIFVSKRDEIFVGNGWTDLPDSKKKTSDASTMIELAMARYSASEEYNPNDANPVYLKDTSYKKLNDQ
jgi:tRNA threonylcarbamoyladenosine biosynthesis protein TsaB